MVPGEHDLDLRQGMQGQQPRLPVQAHIAGNQDIIIPPEHSTLSPPSLPGRRETGPKI